MKCVRICSIIVLYKRVVGLSTMMMVAVMALKAELLDAASFGPVCGGAVCDL